MNVDFRVKVSLFRHPKFKKLKRQSPESALALFALWGFVTENHPDGYIGHIDAEDLAIAADYDGDAGAWVASLLALGFLDRDGDGALHIHDWEDHNPYAAAAPERQEQARKAAETRWSKARGKGEQCQSQSEQCREHKSAMLPDANSNAPTRPTNPTRPTYQEIGATHLSPPPPNGGESDPETPEPELSTPIPEQSQGNRVSPQRSDRPRRNPAPKVDPGDTPEGLLFRAFRRTRYGKDDVAFLDKATTTTLRQMVKNDCTPEQVETATAAAMRRWGKEKVSRILSIANNWLALLEPDEPPSLFLRNVGNARAAPPREDPQDVNARVINRLKQTGYFDQPTATAPLRADADLSRFSDKKGPLH